MDSSRFDALTRSLAETTTRRGLLRLMGGVVAGALGLRAETGVARDRPPRKPRPERPPRQPRSGKKCNPPCKKKNFEFCVDGVCLADVPPAHDPCLEPISCQNGAWVYRVKPDGARCSECGSCQAGICTQAQSVCDAKSPCLECKASGSTEIQTWTCQPRTNGISCADCKVCNDGKCNKVAPEGDKCGAQCGACRSGECQPANELCFEACQVCGEDTTCKVAPDGTACGVGGACCQGVCKGEGSGLAAADICGPCRAGQVQCPGSEGCWECCCPAMTCHDTVTDQGIPVPAHGSSFKLSPSGPTNLCNCIDSVRSDCCQPCPPGAYCGCTG